MRTTVHDADPLPISHYWGLLKGLDDSRKLELASMLIDSVKPIVTTPPDTIGDEVFPDMKKEFYTPEEAYELVMKDVKESLKPYTIEELHARIAESERQFAIGQCKPIEEVFRKWDMDVNMVAEEEAEYGKA